MGGFTLKWLLIFDIVLTVHCDKLYNRTNEMHFLSVIFDSILCMFRINKLFIIRRQSCVQHLVCNRVENIKLFKLYVAKRDTSVGIASRYGLNGRGIESRWGTRPDRPWGPPSLVYNGYRVLPGVKTAGACG